MLNCFQRSFLLMHLWITNWFTYLKPVFWTGSNISQLGTVNLELEYPKFPAERQKKGGSSPSSSLAHRRRQPMHHTPRTRLLSSWIRTTQHHPTTEGTMTQEECGVVLLGWRTPAWMGSNLLRPVDFLETSQQKNGIRHICRPSQGRSP